MPSTGCKACPVDSDRVGYLRLGPRFGGSGSTSCCSVRCPIVELSSEEPGKRGLLESAMASLDGEDVF